MENDAKRLAKRRQRREVRIRWKSRQLNLSTEVDHGGSVRRSVEQVLLLQEKNQEEKSASSLAVGDSSDSSEEEDEQNAIFHRLSQSHQQPSPPVTNVAEREVDYWQQGYIVAPRLLQERQHGYLVYHRNRKWKRRFTNGDFQEIQQHHPTLQVDRRHVARLPPEKSHSDLYLFRPFRTETAPDTQIMIYTFLTRYLNERNAYKLLPLLWKIALPTPNHHHHLEEYGKTVYDFVTHSFLDPEKAYYDYVLSRKQIPDTLRIQRRDPVPWNYSYEGDSIPAMSPTIDFQFTPGAVPPTPIFPTNLTHVCFWSNIHPHNYVSHKETVSYFTFKLTLAMMPQCREQWIAETLKANQNFYHLYLEKMDTENQENPLAALAWTVKESMGYLFHLGNTPKEGAKRVTQALEPYIHHIGIQHFSHICLQYEMIRLAESLPDPASRVLSESFSNPVAAVRSMLEIMENRYWSNDASHLPNDSNLSAGMLEYTLFQTLEKIKLRLNRNPECLELHGWHLALHLGCFVLCSGNRIDGTASRYPSFFLKNPHGFAFTDDDGTIKYTDSEIREKLPNFGRLRKATAICLTSISEMEQKLSGGYVTELMLEFLEWKQALSLFVGPVERSVYTHLCSIHQNYVLRKVGVHRSQIAKSTQNSELLFLSLESNPADIYNWRSVISSLKPLLVSVDGSACQCAECQSVDPGLRVDHSLRESEPIVNRKHWWPSHFLNLSMQSSAMDPKWAHLIHVALKDVNATQSRQASSMIDISTTTVSADVLWTVDILENFEFKEYDEVPTLNERSIKVDSALPQSHDTFSPTREVPDATVPIHGNSLEVTAYRYILACYFAGVNHAGTEMLARQILQSCWNFDTNEIKRESDAMKAYQWLLSRGLDCLYSIKLPSTESHEKYPRPLQEAFLDCLNTSGIDSDDEKKWKPFYDKYPSLFHCFTCDRDFESLFQFLVSSGEIPKSNPYLQISKALSQIENIVHVKELFADCHRRFGKKWVIYRKLHPNEFGKWKDCVFEYFNRTSSLQEGTLFRIESPGKGSAHVVGTLNSSSNAGRPRSRSNTQRRMPTQSSGRKRKHSKEQDSVSGTTEGTEENNAPEKKLVKKPWGPEDIQALWDAVESFGTNWVKIHKGSAHLNKWSPEQLRNGKSCFLVGICVHFFTE